ncbi:MAG TPA: hypothetical protein VK054_14115 [Beutenbergiaceae bacterium]|nr:hypothetical protein [Beutenbergiaceae bacterium]
MSDQYVPTTEQVRDGYVKQMTHWTSPRQESKWQTEFERWLASVKAAAWQEGALWAAAECGVIEPDCPPEQWLTPGDNPYREQETP